MKKTFFLAIICIALTSFTMAQVSGEFRGPGRTGEYKETGLLKKWPAEGPELLWSIENLPSGHSSFSSAHGLVYFTGMRDTIDVLVALDKKSGKIKWQVDYGRAWNASFPKSRCTPTIEEDRLYVSSGLGDLACINAITGKIIWQLKASEKFEGTFGRWGIAESILILDEKLFYTPGGNKTCMVALEKMTGKTIWESETLNDNPSYVSPLLVQEGENKIIVNVTENYIIGVNPADGKIFWKFSFGAFAGGKWKANIHANTPIYDNFQLFLTTGYDHRNVTLELSKNLQKAYFVRSGDILDNHHGGVVKLGDYVYGPNWLNNAMGNWVCMDWNTGEIKYQTKWINKGSIIAAEGMLYCFEEKTGNIALVKAIPEEFKVISSFKVPLGKKGPYWSHPFIHEGVLYMRHGDAVLAYNIKE